MTVVHAEEVAEEGIPSIIRRALEVIGDGPTYITFDSTASIPASPPAPGRRRWAA